MEPLSFEEELASLLCAGWSLEDAEQSLRNDWARTIASDVLRELDREILSDLEAIGGFTG